MGWKSKEVRNEYAKKLSERRKSEGRCAQCGREANGRSICLRCYQYILERRRKQKQKAVDLLGGACMVCGLRTPVLAVYEFHHIDPTKKENKEMDPANIISGRSNREIEKELQKCMLLCANCHRIIHWGSDTLNELRDNSS